MAQSFHIRSLITGIRWVSVWLLVIALLLTLAHLYSGTRPSELGLYSTSTNLSLFDVAQTFGRLPLYFIENQGQLDEHVTYYIQGHDRSIYFTSAGVTFAITQPSEIKLPFPAKFRIWESADYHQESVLSYARWIVKLDFVGANPGVSPIAQDQTQATISYYNGQPDAWNNGLQTYQRLVYPDLWPGIDLVYYGTVDQMKYEFIVRPGANPKDIQLAYSGATNVRLTESGQLAVTSPAGDLIDAAPIAYQEVNGKRIPVSMVYDLAETSWPDASNTSSASHQTFQYGFQIGEYDSTLPLVLDPAVLIYAGYVGGSGSDEGYDIAVDSNGELYITGYTSSAATTFPAMVGPDFSQNGGYDAFVAKVNAAGTALVYAGYIGGSSHDYGMAITVDGAGNAYIAGETWSTEATFPVKVGPDQTFNSGGDSDSDAFVVKVNPTGTALVYAGYIGGSDYELGSGIAVDGDGNAYITGNTASTQTTFPVTGGPDLTYNGGVRDAFLAKVNATGTALIYAGYIGGSVDDYGADIAVDGLGNAYITGETSSSQTSFPAIVGPDLTQNGGSDVFVAKVNTTGSSLVYAGYIGGSNRDVGYGIAVDEMGNALVTGFTFSNQATFPVIVGPDLTHNGGLTDAIVAKVNAAGTTLVYAGYIGGAGNDYGHSIAVDKLGNAYVTGSTNSDQTTFPVAVGPDLTFNGFVDAYVAKVNTTGGVLDYAGYIGGSGEDIGYGIAVDDDDNVYVTGKTNSGEATFPVGVGPDLTYNGGGLAGDAFVTKVSELNNLIYLPLLKK